MAEAPWVMRTYPLVPGARVFIVPVAEKYGNDPWATPDQFCPVPPYVVEIRLAFQVPPDIVPPEIVKPLIVPAAVAFPAESTTNLFVGVEPD